MPSYSSWNGEKMSGHKRMLTDVLKGELGFEGFLISDYDAIDELPGDYRSDIRDSINAGMDMVMVPQKYREFITTLKSLVDAREVSLSRIDDAVRRILRVKFAMGLMEPGKKFAGDPAQQKGFGSAEHRKVARDAVRKSLVLLKNDGNRLPLSKKLARIHVAGKSADDIGNQCGGWTITWQGASGAPTNGTTVLAAIKQAAPGASVTYSKDGTGSEGADVGIVVIGETPYAEFMGDRGDLSLSAEDLAVLANVKRAGIPVVTVLISGRPMIINDALAQSDAFVAAWLPGTEGAGVADVLFGDFAPAGKLPFTWPRSNDQFPINVGDAKYDPLFAYGFGLTYGSASR
jgi:beta-glucosidase